jgi:hypothetical protein
MDRRAGLEQRHHLVEETNDEDDGAERHGRLRQHQGDRQEPVGAIPKQPGFISELDGVDGEERGHAEAGQRDPESSQKRARGPRCSSTTMTLMCSPSASV